MRVINFISGISLAISSLVNGDAPPPEFPMIREITTGSPYQCAPGQSMNITFFSNTLRLDLPRMQFGTTGHGRTDEYAGCQFTVEFSSWWYKYRFAIRDVTYRGHLDATDGVQLYQLKSNAVFRYEYHKLNPGRAPPEVWNVSMSTMFDNTAKTSIGGVGNFNEDFEASGNSSTDLEWSMCMNGGEGSGDVKTKLTFDISATTSDKSGQGTGHLTHGLTLDFGLVWEECIPNPSEASAWGQTRIDDWSTCTYFVM
ncbi:hypothetical protein F4811DRAFT_195086 [Daldinia bambusicola]|nr:hypothetical protein F4811DRAFT_195086 [Daldinia bambusicola]